MAATVTNPEGFEKNQNKCQRVKSSSQMQLLLKNPAVKNGPLLLKKYTR
jgi:hypothetical protein